MEMMPTRSPSILLPALLALPALAAASCVLPPKAPPGGGPALVHTPGPPPELRPEQQPPRPAEGMVWAGGHWRWDGDDFRWTPGKWEPPRPGKRYVPAAHYKIGRNWYFRPPHWAKDPHQPARRKAAPSAP